MARKILFALFYISTWLTIPGQTFTRIDSIDFAPHQYFDLEFQNNLVYMLTDKGMFVFNDSIQPPYIKSYFDIDLNSNTIIELNNTNLLIANNDSVKIFGLSAPETPDLLSTFKNYYYIDDIFDFGQFFIVRIGTSMKLVTVENQNFTTLLNIPLSWNINLTFNYPYLIEIDNDYLLFYKFSSSNTFYLMHSIYENGIYRPNSFNDKLYYYKWVQPDFNEPPDFVGICGRDLSNINFNNIYTGGHTYYGYYFGNYLEASDKYLFIDLNEGPNLVRDFTSGSLIYENSDPNYRLKITNHDAYKLGPTIKSYHNINPEKVFYPHINFSKNSPLLYQIYNNKIEIKSYQSDEVLHLINLEMISNNYLTAFDSSFIVSQGDSLFKYSFNDQDYWLDYSLENDSITFINQVFDLLIINKNYTDLEIYKVSSNNLSLLYSFDNYGKILDVGKSENCFFILTLGHGFKKYMYEDEINYLWDFSAPSNYLAFYVKDDFLLFSNGRKSFLIDHSGNQNAVVIDEYWHGAQIYPVKFINTKDNLYLIAENLNGPNVILKYEIENNSINVLFTEVLEFTGIENFGYSENAILMSKDNVMYIIEDETIPTGINDVRTLPMESYLIQNFPNPFNSQTTISFFLTKPQYAEIILYDIVGNEIGIIENEYYSEGTHTILFDSGPLASGVYIYKLFGETIQSAKKMLILK